jgi:hypothetical protein
LPNGKAFFIIRQLKRFNCRLIYFENTFPFFFCRRIINLQEEQNKGETMKTFYTTESTINRTDKPTMPTTSTDTRAFYRLALRVKYAQRAITERKEKITRLARLVCYV